MLWSFQKISFQAWMRFPQNKNFKPSPIFSGVKKTIKSFQVSVATVTYTLMSLNEFFAWLGLKNEQKHITILKLWDLQQLT